MKSILKKLKRDKSKDEDLENTLPTNDTLEDHRRHILKTGKKHSRPLTDTQQKIVIISTLIAIFVLFFTFWLYFNSVYSQINTSNLVRSVAKIIPTPVIGVNNSFIDYDEVLFQFNTAKNVALNENRDIDDSVALSSAVNKVVEAEVINQIGGEQELSVTDEDLNAGIAEPIVLAGGDETFDSTIMDIYGWSRDDFKKEFKLQLLKSRIVTSEFYDFSTQTDYSNFITLASNLGLSGTTVTDISNESNSPEFVAIAQSLDQQEEVSSIIYGDTRVYIIKSVGDGAYEYVSQTYEEIEAFIQERITQAELVTCLNPEKVTLEGAEKKSAFSCIRS